MTSRRFTGTRSVIHEHQCEKCAKGEYCGLREMYARMIVDRHYRKSYGHILGPIFGLGALVYVLGEKLGVW